jgi:tRNA threonylcarbamoyladenosine biosynthesis protein TsaE
MESFKAGVADLDGLARVATELARHLLPGDVVLLQGDLASGKTTFVKAIGAALGSTSVVTSPTFTLAQFYPTTRADILHVDAYRLTDRAEFRDLGLDDYTPKCINLIEWGEKVAGEFDSYLILTFAVNPDHEGGRELTFASTHPRWTAIFPQLRAALP